MSEKTETTESRFSHVRVKLLGTDGNAFALMGKVLTALRANGATKVEQDTFKVEAMSGDYDHLLTTCTRWVDVY